MPDLPPDAKPKPCPKCGSQEVDLLSDAPETARTLWFRCMTCNYVWRIVRRPILEKRD
jgi:DNA-directed RNA polymerase subunit M/transcription elongation factor TFIIS